MRELPIAEEDLTLTEGDPSPHADLRSNWPRGRERSNFVMHLKLRPPELRLRCHVEGPQSWAPAMCLATLLLALAAAIAVPVLLLPPGAAVWIVAVAAAGSFFAVLVCGVVSLILLSRRRESRHV